MLQYIVYSLLDYITVHDIVDYSNLQYLAVYNSAL